MERFVELRRTAQQTHSAHSDGADSVFDEPCEQLGVAPIATVVAPNAIVYVYDGRDLDVGAHAGTWASAVVETRVAAQP